MRDASCSTIESEMEEEWLISPTPAPSPKVTHARSMKTLTSTRLVNMLPVPSVRPKEREDKYKKEEAEKEHIERQRD